HPPFLLSFQQEFLSPPCPKHNSSSKRWTLSLALGQQYSSLGSQPILCGSIPGLVPKQLRFCRNYIEIMPSVAEGVKLGIQECQHQFRGRRWNCTTIDDSLAIFGPVLDKGNPGGAAGLGAGLAQLPWALGCTRIEH
uniref:Protein Wnt n=1 Tax=Zonotrichia albicollis TaxID=44394 RepID=A0A8D2NJ64_ZONAL